jgi:hypothetical protein
MNKRERIARKILREFMRVYRHPGMDATTKERRLAQLDRRAIRIAQ